MSDTDHDDGFDESFKGFGEDPAPVTPPTDPVTPPATPDAPAEPPKADPPKPAEESKKDEQPPADPKKPEEATPPANDETKPEGSAKPPENPETPPTPEAPKPLTKEDVTSIISNIRTDERTSEKEFENTTKEVMEAYYPDGLSNVLIDQTTGKELRTPADVVAVTNGQMSTDEAAQWLMNEQFKLDKEIDKIKNDAKAIAETTVNFKRDSLLALTKYEPLFKAYPQLQQKIFDKLMKQVKADTEKNVILSAPDVMEFYDDSLEPYQQAYEFATKQSATNPTSAPGTPETPPAPATPGAEDRLDEGGDGGTTKPNDPNDFAQQVSKELAKEL